LKKIFLYTFNCFIFIYTYGQEKPVGKFLKKIGNERLSESYITILPDKQNLQTDTRSLKIDFSNKKKYLLSDTAIILSKNPKTGLPTFIQKNKSIASAAYRNAQSSYMDDSNIELIAKKAISELSASMMLENAEEQFKFSESSLDDKGIRHIKMKQEINGLKVYGGEINIHLNTKDDGLTVNGNYYIMQADGLSDGLINKATLINTIENDLKKNHDYKVFQLGDFSQMLTPLIEKVILPDKNGFSGHIVYHVTYWPYITSRWEYFIDVNTGIILKSIESSCSADGPKIASAKDLNGVTRSFSSLLYQGYYYLLDITKPMYNDSTGNGFIQTKDAKNDTSYRLYNIRNTDNTSWDPKAVSAQFNALTAYDYFKKNHSRNSIDNNNMNIVSVINVPEKDGKSMDNAYWNGRVMAYGNGSADFKPWSGSLDIGGHEMTHGVTEKTANLEYEAQPGAINESMSDVFGSLIDSTNWKIGEDIVLNKTLYPTGALRDLSNPHNGGTKLGDDCYSPQFMWEYYTGSADNYGVHFNSGIPNYAFYLIASNPAIGKVKAGKIYYQALTKYLVKLSQFLDLRLALIQSAKDLYGTTEANIVAQAFDAVGIRETVALPKVSDLKTNPGPEYLITYDKDPSDPNGIYRRTSSGTLIKELTNKTVASKLSITDDGKTAVFVGTDKKIYSLTVDPNVTTEKTLIQTDAIWSNVAISKDGKRIAAVTVNEDTSIYVYDFNIKKWYKYVLYVPTYSKGVTAAGPLYADGIEWDYSGQFIIYDAFNKQRSGDGKDYTYWDINMINVWDNESNANTTGKVSKLFNLSAGDNVGNPTFSKNSPMKIAFDYFNDSLGLYGVIGYDIIGNKIDVIALNNTLGYPTYDKFDSRVAFVTDSVVRSNFRIPITKYVNINSDKISSTDKIPKKLVGWGTWPVYYSVGKRGFVVPPTPKISTTSSTLICDGKAITLTSSASLGNQWYLDGALLKGAVGKTIFADVTGSYSVIVTIDSVQSPPSSAISVIFNTAPAKPTLSRDVSGFLVSSSSTNNLWFKETTALTDTVQKIKPTTSGYYSVKVSKNGCTSLSSDSYYYLTTIYNNLNGEDYFRVAPNPASDIINFNYHLRNSKDMFIDLIDINGKLLLFNKKINSGSKISMSTFMKGVYIIKLKDNSGRILNIQKIIKN
jgi:bacillolysin